MTTWYHPTIVTPCALVLIRRLQVPSDSDTETVADRGDSTGRGLCVPTTVDRPSHPVYDTDTVGPSTLHFPSRTDHIFRLIPTILRASIPTSSAGPPLRLAYLRLPISGPILLLWVHSVLMSAACLMGSPNSFVARSSYPQILQSPGISSPGVTPRRPFAHTSRSSSTPSLPNIPASKGLFLPVISRELWFWFSLWSSSLWPQFSMFLTFSTRLLPVTTALRSAYDLCLFTNSAHPVPALFSMSTLRLIR